MIGFLDLVARRRVFVLVAALASAVVFEVLLRVVIDDERPWGLILGFSLLLPLGLLLGAIFVLRAYHPARLVAWPALPAFRVPPSPAGALMAAGYTIWAARIMFSFVDDAAEEDLFWLSLVNVVLWSGLLTVLWFAALSSRFGVSLGPDGIRERQVFGSLFVPWEALVTPHPAVNTRWDRVTLFYARPELVRRRGLWFGRRGLLPAIGVSAELLARAIHEYVNRPDLRPVIGSAEELARFQAIPQIAELTRA
jgi:hypothetical protein